MTDESSRELARRNSGSRHNLRAVFGKTTFVQQNLISLLRRGYSSILLIILCVRTYAIEYNNGDRWPQPREVAVARRNTAICKIFCVGFQKCVFFYVKGFGDTDCGVNFVDCIRLQPCSRQWPLNVKYLVWFSETYRRRVWGFRPCVAAWSRLLVRS